MCKILLSVGNGKFLREDWGLIAGRLPLTTANGFWEGFWVPTVKFLAAAALRGWHSVLKTPNNM